MNISINDLTFSYSDQIILEKLSVELEFENTCIGLVGHNGAGKSTLLNIICDIITSYKGQVKKSKNLKMAYLPFDNPIYDDFTVKDNLLIWYQIYTNKKFSLNDTFVKNIIYVFHIKELLNRKVEWLSSGEKKKVSLACVFFSNADIFILDEPFTGLDPVITSQICDIITKYKAQGKGFLITSHQLDILEKILDRLIILKKGAFVFDLPKEKITTTLTDTYIQNYG